MRCIPVILPQFRKTECKEDDHASLDSLYAHFDAFSAESGQYCTTDSDFCSTQALHPHLIGYIVRLTS